jgi:hypothetical protein
MINDETFRIVARASAWSSDELLPRALNFLPNALSFEVLLPLRLFVGLWISSIPAIHMIFKSDWAGSVYVSDFLGLDFLGLRLIFC